MKQQLSNKAIGLLRRTQNALRRFPKLYDQSEPGYFRLKPSCGSPVCIIGWMRYFAFVRMNKKRRENLVSIREVSIGLTQGQWAKLFYATFWPGKYRFRNSEITAETAIARIDHFIATDGQQ